MLEMLRLGEDSSQTVNIRRRPPARINMPYICSISTISFSVLLITILAAFAKALGLTTFFHLYSLCPVLPLSSLSHLLNSVLTSRIFIASPANMPGATRSSYRKAAFGKGETCSQKSAADCSSSAMDDDINVVAEPSHYATPPQAQSDVSLSSTLEDTDSRHGSDETAKTEVEPLGQHVKEAIETISRLEGLGLQKFRIPLPKCLVLGEQSAGKSSVIEAISGIKTPRSTDTCTRCPLFIKMESTENPGSKWHARVYIRTGFSLDRNAGKGSKKGFTGWKELETPSESEFSSTSSPEELEEMIARAQLAVLSDVKDMKLFLDGKLEDLYPQCEAEFSPNLVCISISQPGLPNLSFYDLPGVIGQAEDTRKQFLVDFVEDLVTGYVRDPDALILLTCSLSNDISNSHAAKIARRVNAEDRCVGVLTKPDCLPSGSREDTLRNILDGKKYQLGHGYFVVKNLAQNDIDNGLTHQDARLQERNFFEHTPLWSTTFCDHGDRFGTQNLQAYLSKRLAAQILRALPTIREQLTLRLVEVEGRLKQIPEPPTHNAVHIVTDILRGFTRNVELEMEGDHKHCNWLNDWELLQQCFADALQSMKPRLGTSGSRDTDIYTSKSSGKSVDDYILIDDSDSDADADDDVLKSTDLPTPSKKRRLDQSTPDMSPTKKISKTLKRDSENGASQLKSKFDFSALRKIFKLDDVVSRLKQTSKSKFPDQLQPKVLDKMMLETIEQWHLPMNLFFSELKLALYRKIERVFHENFHQWIDAELYGAAWKVVNEVLSNHLSEQKHTMASEALKDELEGPYIFHKPVLAHEQSIIQDYYKQARFNARKKTYFDEYDRVNGKETTNSERDSKVQKDERLRGLLSKEPYAYEMGVVSKITSNYVIASRRFHDSVCMRIQCKFFKALRDDLYGELVSGLQIGGPKGYENCISLLVEKSSREGERKQLIKKKEALVKGQQCLSELEAKYENGRDSRFR
ncbi:hypothetical protein CC78DRAFT_236102 [Lojkania enalia]|uniref:GED domain-containing protein n=1 Tax=Lojkania enalia TaxID=147567 RepID=A0A9P4TNR7_9PLEO|nr:hypothetical protein CC78DRAFT_236102 [Didymosphaeria enalia]